MNAAALRERELSRFRPVTELALPSRATNALLRSGVRSVGQLITRSREDLMTEIIGLGQGTLKAVEAALALENLSLAPSEIPSSVFARTSAGQVRGGPKTNRHIRNHNERVQPGDESP